MKMRPMLPPPPLPELTSGGIADRCPALQSSEPPLPPLPGPLPAPEPPVAGAVLALAGQVDIAAGEPALS